MGDIFARAELVIVWLGAEEPLTKVAFDAIRKINANIADVGGRSLFRKKTPSEKYQVLQDLIVTERWHYDHLAWRALSRLIQNEWFNRMWVVPEYVLARATVFMCGKEELLSDILIFVFIALWQANHRLVVYGNDTSQDVTTAQRNYKSLIEMDMIYERRRDGIYTSIIKLLLFTAQRSATDSRDRLHALLGLAPDLTASIVDYTLDVAEVYRGLAMYFLEVEHSLEIFSLVGPPTSPTECNIPSPMNLSRHISEEAAGSITGLTDVSKEAGGHVKLPSWVPDLRTRRRNMPMRYRASGSSQPSITVVSNEVISCRGKILDTIRDVTSGPRHDGVGSQGETYEIMQECDRFAGLQRQPYPGGEDAVDVLWRTLIMNADWTENTASADHRGLYLEWREHLRLSMEGEDVE